MLPQRPGKIAIAVCVLVCLGLFALVRFPKDEKSSERGVYEPGMTEPLPKGGMVQLKAITPVPVNHDGSGAMKQAMILKGQVPHLTGFTRAVFSPGDEVQMHSHATMDEVFYGEAGKGSIEVDGVMVEMTAGTCVHVAAGQKHNLKNHGDEDWVILYFGIATGSVGGEMNPVSISALRATNP